MYGTYAWKAGATAAQVVGDLLALCAGTAVAALSDGCDKAASAIAGEASAWRVDDAPFGVLSAPCLHGATARKEARITVTAGSVIQLAPVEDWNIAAHVAGYAGAPQDASLSIAAAGAVSIIVHDEVLAIAAADWSKWGILAECKRDAPVLADDTVPNWAVMGTGAAYMPRLKSPNAAGDTTSPGVTVAGAYGNMSASAARNRLEQLYVPMVPLVVSYSQVPVGEVAGCLGAAPYGNSGDVLTDAGGQQFTVAKYGAYAVCVKRK